MPVAKGPSAFLVTPRRCDARVLCEAVADVGHARDADVDAAAGARWVEDPAKPGAGSIARRFPSQPVQFLQGRKLRGRIQMAEPARPLCHSTYDR
jgi:hypothetical protein